MKHHIHEGTPGLPTRALLRGAARFECGPWMVAVYLVAALVLTGCRSPVVYPQQMAVNEKAPRPGRIMVHDFAATLADIPSDAPVGARISGGASLPPEQIAMDRRLGSDMAALPLTPSSGVRWASGRAFFRTAGGVTRDVQADTQGALSS